MLDLVENSKLLMILMVINLPLYFFIGKSFYNSWVDFTEALRYLFQPGWLSAIRGEFNDDFWETLKFYCYIATCAALVAIQYKMFS